MKLLEKIDGIELSDEEKDRINKGLRESASLQHRVFTTKAPAIHDYDFWRRAQRTLRVTGFRDGHPAAIKIVLTRALEAQKIHAGRDPHAGWPLIWPLYLRTVHQYLRDDLPSLHQLIKSEDFQSGPGSLTEQILRTIVKCLPLYEATVEEVRTLYELWGFERTQYSDEILTNPPVDADAVRRMVDESVTMVRREIANAIAATKSDTHRQLHECTGQLATLERLLQGIKEEVARNTAKLINGGPTTTTAEKGTEQASTLVPHGKVQPVPVVFRRRANDPSAAALQALQTRTEGLGRQIKELRNRIELIEPRQMSTATPRRSDLTLTTALQVINAWTQAFGEAGIPAASIGVSWILLEIVRRSRIVLTDKPQLFRKLFSCLPNSDVRLIVASPTWISGADWNDSLSYIADASESPRLLIIQDFNVAIQEVYLVPTLIHWASNLPPECANRIVLVPSDTELANVSPRVFELATFALHTAPYIRDLKRLGDGIVDSPPTLELPQRAASIISYLSSTNVSMEDDLRKYAANYGIALPPRVLEHFVSLCEGLRTSLKIRDAEYIAQQAIVMPWIEKARGDAVARTFQEALKTV